MRVVIFAKPGGKDPLPKEFEFGYVNGEMGGKLVVIPATPPRFGKSILPKPEDATTAVFILESQIFAQEIIEDGPEQYAVGLGWASRMANAMEVVAESAITETQQDLLRVYTEKLAEATDGYLRHLNEASTGS